jgi:polyisoprenoid-binding protein YceI
VQAHRLHRITIITAVAALVAFARPGFAGTSWHADAGRSRLDFSGRQAGAEFTGTFHDFAADIVFDGADLESSRFDVRIDTASVDTADGERDEVIRGSDLFAVAEFPTARYVAAKFERLETDFVAHGELTLRGHSKAVPVRFRFVRDGGQARLVGSATFDRLDFGVGQGDWRDTEWVANRITVEFNLVLEPAQPAQ